MKKTHVFSAILFAALPFASQGFAEVEPTPLPGTVAKVAFNLTISTDVAGTVAKDQFGKPLKKTDEGFGPAFENTYSVMKKEVKLAEVNEYVSKIATRKYSIKEFLTDLVDLGVIEDIKGYSLVQVVQTYTEGSAIYPGTSGFFLIKKGADSVDVSDYFDLDYCGKVFAENVVTETPFAEGEPTTPVKYSYTAKFKGKGYIEIDLDDEEVEDEEIYEEYSAQGSFAGSEKTGTVGKDKTPVFIPGAGKLTGAVGEYSYESEDEEIYFDALVEGSASISAGAPSADVSSYFPVSES